MKTSTFYNNKAASSPGGWSGICNSKGKRRMVTRSGRGSSVFFPSWYKKGRRQRVATCNKAVSQFSASLRQSEVQRGWQRFTQPGVIVTRWVLWHGQGVSPYVTSGLHSAAPLPHPTNPLNYGSYLSSKYFIAVPVIRILKFLYWLENRFTWAPIQCTQPGSLFWHIHACVCILSCNTHVYTLHLSH